MPKSYEYYISKGFDSLSAKYFANGRRKPISVVPQNDYKLLITFDNSEKKYFDVGSLIKKGTVYYPLKNLDIFMKCYIDSDNSICWDKDSNIDSNIQWSNKIDIGADTCYLNSTDI